MAHRLHTFLIQTSFQKHFVFALVFGVLFRAIASYFIFGYTFADDFMDWIVPSYLVSEGLPYDFFNFRMPNQLYLMSWFFDFTKILGFGDNPISQIRVFYFLISLISLLAFWGARFFYLAYQKENPLFGILVLYLIAIHCIMPFISTRALTETISFPLVFLGFGMAEYGRIKQFHKWFIFGVFLIGLAAIFRFQVGLFFVGYAFCFLFKKEYKHLLYFFGAGVLLLCVQVLSEWAYGRYPFETLINYIKINELSGLSQIRGAKPWYVYITAILLACFLPLVFFTKDRLMLLWKKQFFIVIPVVFFVLMHSLIDHKEERFMIPVLPLVFALLAYIWSKEFLNKNVIRFFTMPFLVLNFILLFIVNTNNTQAGTVEPYVDLYKLANRSVIYQINFFNLPKYYLRGDYHIRHLETKKFEISDVERLFRENKSEKNIYLIGRGKNILNGFQSFQKQQFSHFSCGKIRNYSSLLDRIVFSINPKRNEYRAPFYSVMCKRSS